MPAFLMNVAKLRNGRYIGAIRVDGVITATTLPFRNRNSAATAGFSLKSDLMRQATSLRTVIAVAPAVASWTSVKLDCGHQTRLDWPVNEGARIICTNRTHFAD